MASPEKNRLYVRRWLERHSHKQGIIFQVVNVVTGEEYIGKTTSPLQKRWHQIISHANSGRTDKLSTNIRLHGQDSFEIKELYRCGPEDDIGSILLQYLADRQPVLNTNLI